MQEATRRFSYCAPLASATLAVALLWGTTAQAGTVTFNLGEPSLNGSTVDFLLSAVYAPTGGRKLVEFQIDVSGSSPQLSLNNTNYSAFSFTLAPPLASDWNAVGPVLSPPPSSLAQYDTLTGPIVGSSALAILSVDLGSLGLSTNVPYTVRIDGPGTKAGDEVPGDHTTFDPNVPVFFARASQTTVATTVIPLPSAVWTAVPLLGGLILARILRRR